MTDVPVKEVAAQLGLAEDAPLSQMRNALRAAGYVVEQDEDGKLTVSLPATGNAEPVGTGEGADQAESLEPTSPEPAQQTAAPKVVQLVVDGVVQAELHL